MVASAVYKKIEVYLLLHCRLQIGNSSKACYDTQARLGDHGWAGWSGGRGSNPRHSVWKTDALPLSYPRANVCVANGHAVNDKFYQEHIVESLVITYL